MAAARKQTAKPTTQMKHRAALVKFVLLCSAPGDNLKDTLVYNIKATSSELSEASERYLHADVYGAETEGQEGAQYVDGEDVGLLEVAHDADAERGGEPQPQRTVVEVFDVGHVPLAPVRFGDLSVFHVDGEDHCRSGGTKRRRKCEM